jgi:NAD(P)-dependent dehydrogenase (short-subunit alcohol dehydrogenase family)
MGLNGQVAIVTGGGQGIGQQIVLRLAQEGARVVIADPNREGSEETAARIARNGYPKARVLPADITDEKQVARLVTEAMTIDQRIDILVNNAGIMGPVKNVEDILLEEWEQTMAVNLRGMFLCCKHTIPIMKKQGKGSIVNIASGTGKKPLTQRLPYAASKMAVIGLTRTLAAEVGKWNIRVNTICPGPVKGPRLDRVIEGVMKYSGKSREEVTERFTEGTALKTLVDPKYIAAVVAFLCTEDAAMMTGQDINVSAGATMF